MKTPRRILLVEDDQQDVELILGALEAERLVGYVTVVRDGVEALEYLQCRGPFVGRHGENPAVVLLDIKMPRLNGLEVLERMRSDPQLRMVPVVILTGSREEHDLARAYRLGANAYVVKPVDFTQLVGVIRQVGVFWVWINEAPDG